jgi:hypothetical protein
MSYAILRIAKLSNKTGKNSLNGSAKHNFREQATENANVDKTGQNCTIGAKSSDEVVKALNDRLGTVLTIRKNAVLAVEYFIGMSPEFAKTEKCGDIEGYFDMAEAWLVKKHGAENVLSVTRQYDETTPHICAYVVPIDKHGKLNASAFFDGKKMLSDLQTDFAETCGKPFGLCRGIEGSKATHTRISQFYADLNREPVKIPNIEQVKLPETKMLESKADYALRSIAEYRKKFDPALSLLTRQASLNATHEKTAIEAKKTAFMAQLEAEKQRLLAQELQQSTDEKIQQVKKLLFLPDDQLLEARRNLFEQERARLKSEKSKIEVQEIHKARGQRM